MRVYFLFFTLLALAVASEIEPFEEDDSSAVAFSNRESGVSQDDRQPENSHPERPEKGPEIEALNSEKAKLDDKQSKSVTASPYPTRRSPTLRLEIPSQESDIPALTRFIRRIYRRPKFDELVERVKMRLRAFDIFIPLLSELADMEGFNFQYENYPFNEKLQIARKCQQDIAYLVRTKLDDAKIYIKDETTWQRTKFAIRLLQQHINRVRDSGIDLKRRRGSFSMLALEQFGIRVEELKGQLEEIKKFFSDPSKSSFS